MNRRSFLPQWMTALLMTLLTVATPPDAEGQVRRGRSQLDPVRPWAPIAVGVRFGYDQTARGELGGVSLRIPIVRSGIVEFNPSADLIFLSGPDQYAYNLDLAFVPGGTAGGLVLGAGVGWRDATLGPVRTTFFGYNLSVGGKTSLGPVQIEALIRWSLLNGTDFDPNTVTLGVNYLLGSVPRPGS